MSANGWDGLCGETLNGSLVLVSGNDIAPCFRHILSTAFFLPLLFSCAACLVTLRRELALELPLSCPYRVIVRGRQAVVAGLLFLTAAKLACEAAVVKRTAYILYAQIILAFLTLCLLCLYLSATLGALPKYLRGHGIVVFTYIPRVLIDLVSLHSSFLARTQSGGSQWFSDASYFLSFATIVVHVLFLSSLIPSPLDLSGGASQQPNGRFSGLVVNERTPLLLGREPAGDSEEVRIVLPTGRVGGLLSRLGFLWVNPLMAAGFGTGLRSSADTFHLPESLKAGRVASLFAYELRKSAGKPQADSNRSSDPSLLRAMHHSFGKQYYAAGVLKLAADALGFCGPLLLGGLVSFAEDRAAPASSGALYAVGLFGSTLVAALLSAHFDYGVQVVGLKARAALVSATYSRVLAASAAKAAQFSAGELVNFMSTDADRIVNFCPSFHQFWSLPLQIAVSLYLLYLQVGVASMAGLAFAVILVPVNRWIAVKIGKLSSLMMEQKDGRVKIMTELLHGVRSVKMLAWEGHFCRRLGMLREGELRSLRGRKYLDALCVYFWATTPVLISILTFAAYALLGHRLTAAKVFTSLSLFNMLIGPLNAFPWVVNGLMEAWVSLKRLQAFVSAVPARDPSLPATEKSSDHSRGDCVIQFKKATYSWSDGGGEEERSAADDACCSPFRLSLVDLRVASGSLTGVIGPVGCGKSSLLAAMAGEMALLSNDSGSACIQRAVDRDCLASNLAVVPQTAWLQRGSVRDNILFGRAYDSTRYEQVVWACALTDDFRVLPHGDASQVGENGSMLSGGQRARVTLARAAYQDKDVYLLDDPLAAVDAKVAAHIFERCILGLLAGKTRILCTHHTHFLRCADLVVAMDSGCIAASGFPEDILPRYTSADETQLLVDAGNHALTTTIADSVLDSEEGCGAFAMAHAKQKDVGGKDGGQDKEAKEEGTVRLSVYKAYASAVGVTLSVFVLLSVFLMQGSKNVNDWWLSYWVAHDIGSSANSSSSNTSSADAWSTSSYLYVYCGLAGANTVFTLVRAFLFAYGGLCAAAIVHDRLLHVVLKAPLSFFDCTPTGRIVNRFSSDVYTVDDSLPFIANILLAQTFSVLGTLAVTCYGLPWFLIALAPLSLIYYRVQRYYRPSSRELKRITSVTLSSLYAHLSESVEGRAVIRAFGECQRFERENADYLDLNLRAQFSAIAAAQWLNVRLQALGVAMVTAVALLALVEHSYGVVNPGLVGLAMSYALSITGLLSGVVSSFTETEKQMVAVERVKQYIDGIEPERTEGVIEVDHCWPAHGVVEFQDVSLCYAPGLPLALAKVSLRIAPGERVGIVGRTGSGKSSLFNALFRTAELADGSVYVDGVNVRHAPLSSLRSRLAIIPQTPFLFSGSVRDNLDPGGLHVDADLWRALDKCHLRAAMECLGGLDAELPERGRTLSVGQSQLFCLARAVLRGSKVLCIDEGTANVDRETDKLVQVTIRNEFAQSSVLTIAHRIKTVLDYDRIVVLSRGAIVEAGPPRELLGDTSSFLSAALRHQVR